MSCSPQSAPGHLEGRARLELVRPQTTAPNRPAELCRLALGVGAGIEIAEHDLRVAIARARPRGARIDATTVIHGFRDRPAAEWGREYLSFLKHNSVSHLSAVVVLPRAEVIVRQVDLRGIADREFAGAIRYQLDALHPYAEDAVEFSWAPAGPRGRALVGIVHREVLERYISLFAEAGVNVACFTFSAAVLYSAIRLRRVQPSAGFVTLVETGTGLEAYGESETKPVFSAHVDLPPERACALAAAELRIGSDARPTRLEEILPWPRSAPPGHPLARNPLPYAAALTGACPRLALRLNLLPPEHRTATSRLRLAPTAILALITLILLLALGSIRPVEDQRYLAALNAEIKKLEPEASKRSPLNDRSIEQARKRSLLDNFRGRTKSDLDVISELTNIVEAPAWLSALELSRDSITITGQSEKAPGLLKAFDQSPLFRESEFAMPLTQDGQRHTFRIRAAREGVQQ